MGIILGEMLAFCGFCGVVGGVGVVADGVKASFTIIAIITGYNC